MWIKKVQVPHTYTATTRHTCSSSLRLPVRPMLIQCLHNVSASGIADKKTYAIDHLQLHLNRFIPKDIGLGVPIALAYG